MAPDTSAAPLPAFARAREQLRQGVEQATVLLGCGFLAHPANTALRGAARSGALQPRSYFDQLVRTVYRLVFLLAAEQRELLHPESAGQAERTLYAERYAVQRLLGCCPAGSPPKATADLWQSQTLVMRGLAKGDSRLGLPPLGGLFDAAQCPALETAQLDDATLLGALLRLAWLPQPEGFSPVDWRQLGPEDLASAYEGLLELVPRLVEGEFRLEAPRDGEHARRSSGSYYTPGKLVCALLDGALQPVVQRTLRDSPGREADALLELCVLDPTCGSGHFLLAAGRRLAAAVARARGSDSPAAQQRALREVVGRCLFGVDLNPLAVELCKLNLWMAAAQPGLPLSFADAHLQHGNAVLGTTPAWMARGIPDAAFSALGGEDSKVASALKKRNQQPRAGDAPEGQPAAGGAHDRLSADAWCAAFVWPKDGPASVQAAPTNGLWQELRHCESEAPDLTVGTVRQLAERYRFLHWHLAYPQVFARGGFDLVLGNPPWIAHAGRAAQPLDPGVKRFYRANFSTFAGYPTTHGIFIALAASLLRPGGAMGLIVPSSVSELPKYEPTRRAHDQLCDPSDALVDFGEGQFPGVTQPCMALISHRREGGRVRGQHGEPWAMLRPDLDDTGRALLAQLTAQPPLPASLFGERGFQSDPAAQRHFLASAVPHGRFTLGLRQGTDVREFQLLPPRLHADPGALSRRLRAMPEYQAVRLLVRNTARYPIAALSDGAAFRNSLLAGFGSEEWPATALVAMLNSSLLRWLHYVRFRDARQPVMPQVKIGHLRAIPRPPPPGKLAAIEAIGARLSQNNAPPSAADRAELDAAVFELYQVEAPGRELVEAWQQISSRAAECRSRARRARPEGG
jgi:hypothetical protein